jgi:hypothetical protein
VILLLTLGCSSLTTFTIDGEATTVVERGSILEDLLGDLGFSDWVSMDLTESEELKNQGVQPGDISEVRLTLLELEATAPEDGDLSFLDDMVVYAEAPEVDEAEVARADDFPEGQALVVFELSDVDLTPYAVSESMTLSTDVTAHRPEQDTTVTARFEVDVTATVQGIRNQF